MVSQSMLSLGRRRSVIREIFEYGNRRKAEIGADRVFDFSLGNPSIPAPPQVTQTLQRLLRESDPAALHAYTSAPGDLSVRRAIADYAKRTFDFPADPALIYMTAGAAASLTVTLTALVGMGDEVIALAPFFPEYTVFVERTGAKLIPVLCRQEDFQVDEAALAAAITPATHAILINSPNNPTGAVLTKQSIEALASVLTEKAKAFGHPIYLISDEPYRELVYDGVEVPYLPLYYRDTVVCYSFSKSLSLPGERIGYILVSPQAADAGDVFDAVCGAGRALGFVCAPSLFQQLVKECVGLTADIAAYDRNRRRLYSILTDCGFSVVRPDGAFYLFMQSPEPDASAFCERAREQELLLVPSDDFGYPGFVRIAYCVSAEQIERSADAFRRLAASYHLTVKEETVNG